jgi:hypothetical protein
VLGDQDDRLFPEGRDLSVCGEQSGVPKKKVGEGKSSSRRLLRSPVPFLSHLSSPLSPLLIHVLQCSGCLLSRERSASELLYPSSFSSIHCSSPSSSLCLPLALLLPTHLSPLPPPLFALIARAFDELSGPGQRESWTVTLKRGPSALLLTPGGSTLQLLFLSSPVT